jgi:hypothetical protein
MSLLGLIAAAILFFAVKGALTLLAIVFGFGEQFTTLGAALVVLTVFVINTLRERALRQDFKRRSTERIRRD